MYYIKIINDKRYFEFLLIFIIAIIISNNFFLGYENYLVNSHYTLKEYFLLDNNSYLNENTFPTGVKYYNFSILPWLYLVLDIFFNNFIATQSFIVFLEIITFYYSLVFFLKKFFDYNLKFTFRILLIFSFLFTEFLYINFAMLRLPLYEGLHYIFSISFGLLSLSFLKYRVRSNIFYSYIFLTLSFLMHSMIGIYNLIFILIYFFLKKNFNYFFLFLSNLILILSWYIYIVNFNCGLNECKFEKISFADYRTLSSILSFHQISEYNVGIFLNNFFLPTIIIYIMINIFKNLNINNKNDKLILKIIDILFILSFIFLFLPLIPIYHLNVTRIYGLSLLLVILFLVYIFKKASDRDKPNFFYYPIFEIIIISKLTFISLFFFIFNLNQDSKKISIKIFSNKIKILFLLLSIIYFIIFFNFELLEKVNYLKSLIGCVVIYLILYRISLFKKNQDKIILSIFFLIIIKNIINLNSYKNYFNSEYLAKSKNLISISQWVRENTKKEAKFIIHPKVNDIGILAFTHRAEFGSPRTLLFKSWNTNLNKSIYDEGIKRFCHIVEENCNFIFENKKHLNKNNLENLINIYNENLMRIDQNLIKKLNQYNIEYAILEKNNKKHKNIVYENNHFILIKINEF